ncbi:hypothetical protein [Aestuariivita boseongensis]|jgi:hypothetical protein|uniref:hypothetical protein n=1 Tax=Aestuariivita boseongensis TaxID=1470562 RepID=UPI0006801496|nr:hypothetical protein [Aestuariivita boseongensis]
MNANQIINMIIRRVMRIAVNKGVDMGIQGASSAAKKMRNGKKAQGDDVYIDDYGNPVHRKDNSRG